MSKPFMIVENGKGEKVELELVDRINIENDNYVILSQIGTDEAFAYKVINKNGQNQYASIGAGAEFKRVLEKYNEKHD
jgi:hypothetical protein